MTIDERRVQSGGRWIALALNVVFAVYCVAQFASIGTARAFIFAIAWGSLPLVAWYQASRLRGRGYAAGANTLLITTAGIQMMLGMLAMYTAELAEQAASCGCPPR
jgi:hypothetical protein